MKADHGDEWRGPLRFRQPPQRAGLDFCHAGLVSDFCHAGRHIPHEHAYLANNLHGLGLEKNRSGLVVGLRRVDLDVE